MVLLGNFLKLGLGLNPAQDVGPEDDGGALVRFDNAAQSVPSYATNIQRFHYTVKRARSIIERRDTSVAVPHSELHSILTKIEDLEQQVRALLKEDNAPAPTSPAPGLGPGSPPPSDKKNGSGDQDCDAENLLYDLGARAVVDANGQVSGHPLFRRNANCPMESAVNGKNSANTSGSSDSSKASAAGGPSAGDGSPDNHKTAGSVGAEGSSEERQKAKEDGGAGDARTGLPQVVSATVETVEVQTVPVNGKLVTTTITRTATRLSRVTVVRHPQATDAAGQETSEGTDRAIQRPQDGTGSSLENEKPKSPQHVPTAPTAGSYAQFSNDTSKFSNSNVASNASPGGNQAGSQAEDQKTTNVGVDEKASNRTLTEKTEAPKQISNEPVQETEKAGHATAPQDAVSVTPEESDNHATMADKLVNSSSQETVSLTEAEDSWERSGANTVTVKDAGETAAASTTADEKPFSGTPDQASNPAPDMVNTNGRVQVITVVPIPAKAASASPVAATPAVTPDTARDKAKPATIAAVGANETVPRAETGFKTVRVPESK